MSREYKWIKKGVKLFKPGKEYREYSYIGWGDMSLQFHGYISGYKHAADTLVDEALASEDNRTLDTLVYPIFFLYRQFIELAMKGIFINYGPLTHAEKSRKIGNVSHSLMKMWKEIKPVMNECATEADMADIETAEDYIKQFDQFDRDSFSFRYPVSKSLELIHKEWRFLDLPSIKERMAELYNFFEGVDCQLAAYREFRSEMTTYYSE